MSSALAELHELGQKIIDGIPTGATTAAALLSVADRCVEVLTGDDRSIIKLVDEQAQFVVGKKWTDTKEYTLKVAEKAFTEDDLRGAKKAFRQLSGDYRTQEAMRCYQVVMLIFDDRIISCISVTNHWFKKGDRAIEAKNIGDLRRLASALHSLVESLPPGPLEEFSDEYKARARRVRNLCCYLLAHLCKAVQLIRKSTVDWKTTIGAALCQTFLIQNFADNRLSVDERSFRAISCYLVGFEGARRDRQRPEVIPGMNEPVVISATDFFGGGQTELEAALRRGAEVLKEKDRLALRAAGRAPAPLGINSPAAAPGTPAPATPVNKKRQAGPETSSSAKKPKHGLAPCLVGGTPLKVLLPGTPGGGPLTPANTPYSPAAATPGRRTPVVRGRKICNN